MFWCLERCEFGPGNGKVYLILLLQLNSVDCCYRRIKSVEKEEECISTVLYGTVKHIMWRIPCTAEVREW